MNAWQVKVPGKIMLCGEYSALQGEKTLACTLDAFLTAEINPADDYTLNSNLWPESKTFNHRSQFDLGDPYESCVAASIPEKTAKGFSLTIKSDLDVRFGVGSSSALRLACFHALAKFNNEHDDVWQSAAKSFDEQKKDQNNASGYDIATQLLGGTVCFQPTYQVAPRRDQCQKFAKAADHLNEFTTVMVGPKGSATGELIEKTSSWLEVENRYRRLNRYNRNLQDTFEQFFEDKTQLPELLKHVGAVRRFFLGSPNFPEWMRAAEDLPEIDETWSYKLTGAGGEDAVLVFGANRGVGVQFFQKAGWHILPYKFSDQGMSIEEVNLDV